MKIIKAPKKSEIFAEYWPNKADGALIENAKADIKYLLDLVDTQAKRNEELTQELADMDDQRVFDLEYMAEGRKIVERHMWFKRDSNNLTCNSCGKKTYPGDPGYLWENRHLRIHNENCHDYAWLEVTG